MAGIGIQLNKIFGKHTVTSSIYGIGYSFVYTIAPMLVVMGCLLAMYEVLGFDLVGYQDRELFSCSILYIFIFSLLTSSPFNSVLSKFQTDKIYEQRYEDIRPCIYVGTITNLTLSSMLAIPFYLYEIVIGQVPIYYVFTTYMGFLGLTLTFSTMLYNSILKQYKKISLYFICSMILSFLLSILFRYLLGFSITYSMLLALTIGFLVIASLELSNVLRYFPKNSHNYREVLYYYRIYWKLIGSNFLYTLGLFAHNFVFWAQPWHLVVRNTYVCNQPYDMASCLAMFSNISASVLFISRVEMHFHERYQDYTQAVIGGKLDSIEEAKKRMFRGLSSQLFSLVHTQFIVSVIIYLIAVVTLPIMGFSGMIMEIYPQLAVGYFISYLMYSELLFLYYFDDLTGAMANGLIYAGVSLFGSIAASRLPVIWYGIGFTTASFLAFTFSYFRLRWIERNLDSHIFCRGTVLKQVSEDMPPSDVYNVYKSKTANRIELS
jgi:uncharacterized membrane protein